MSLCHTPSSMLMWLELTGGKREEYDERFSPLSPHELTRSVLCSGTGRRIGTGGYNIARRSPPPNRTSADLVEGDQFPPDLEMSTTKRRRESLLGRAFGIDGWVLYGPENGTPWRNLTCEAAWESSHRHSGFLP
jgi:hypothetical protein